MKATKLDADTIMVVSVEPVMLDAAQFGMDEGIEELCVSNHWYPSRQPSVST